MGMAPARCGYKGMGPEKGEHTRMAARNKKIEKMYTRFPLQVIYFWVFKLNFLRAKPMFVSGVELLIMSWVKIIRIRTDPGSASSVVDPDPHWIRIQELPGSGSTHANIGRKWRQKMYRKI